MKSTEQMLRNPDIAPSSDVIAKALGEANNAYIKFINEIASHDIQIDWRYYNDGKAWLAKGLFKWRGVRGGQNETTIFWLSIWDGFFKVTIYIPEKARAEVLSLPLDSDISELWDKTLFKVIESTLFYNIITGNCPTSQWNDNKQYYG